MVGLALKCYPENLDYVDKSLQTISDTFARRKIEKYDSLFYILLYMY